MKTNFSKLFVFLFLFFALFKSALVVAQQPTPDQEEPALEETTPPVPEPADTAPSETQPDSVDAGTETPIADETNTTQSQTQPSPVSTPPQARPLTTSSPTCPATLTAATLLVNHSITQDYLGNKMTSLVSGSLPLTIGPDVVKGSGTNTIKVSMSGSFPQAQCTMKGERDLAITLKGICEAGTITLILNESYLAGSQTMACPGTSKAYPVPANTVSHTIKLRVQNGSAYTAPFAGQSGSGHYSWSLKM